MNVHRVCQQKAIGTRRMQKVTETKVQGLNESPMFRSVLSEPYTRSVTDSIHLDAGSEPGVGSDLRRASLLQCAGWVVDAIFRMARIHDFEDHVIAGLEGFDHGIELILGSGWMFVDADDD